MMDKQKVQTAVERIRTFAERRGYWLAFSGGKDSVVLYRLAEMSGVPFEAHYSMTTIDPPEVIRFIHRYYPTVRFDRPEYNFKQLVLKYMMPPNRKVRYCCRELKERGGIGWTVLTGIRWAESLGRQGRKMLEPCHYHRRWLLNPMLDWTDTDVWEFIHSEGLPYCELYDEGFDRVGCVMCPLQSKLRRIKDAHRWPNYYKMFMKLFAEMIELRREKGRTDGWRTAEEVMDWYLDRTPINTYNVGLLKANESELCHDL